MQFAIAAQRVAQSAFGFRERRWIENDQVILVFRFFSRAQELKNILFDPFYVQLIALRVELCRCDVFRTRFYSTDSLRSSMRTRQRKCALVCETIEHAPVARILPNDFVILFLIEIKTGLLPVQKIDIEL